MTRGGEQAEAGHHLLEYHPPDHRAPDTSVGFTLETAPSRRVHTPAATTHDADDAGACEPEAGPWNLWARLPVTRRTEALTRAAFALLVLLALVACSAVTRHRTERQGGQDGQSATLLVGLLWSLLTAPAAVWTLYLFARYALILLREHAGNYREQPAADVAEPGRDDASDGSPGRWDGAL